MNIYIACDKKVQIAIVIEITKCAPRMPGHLAAETRGLPTSTNAPFPRFLKSRSTPIVVTRMSVFRHCQNRQRWPRSPSTDSIARLQVTSWNRPFPRLRYRRFPTWCSRKHALVRFPANDPWSRHLRSGDRASHRYRIKRRATAAVCFRDPFLFRSTALQVRSDPGLGGRVLKADGRVRHGKQ